MSVDVQRIENFAHGGPFKEKDVNTDKKWLEADKENNLNTLSDNMNDADRAKNKQSLMSKMVPGEHSLLDNGQKDKDGDTEDAIVKSCGDSDIVAKLNAKMEHLKVSCESPKDTSVQNNCHSAAVEELTDKLNSLGCEDTIPSLTESQGGDELNSHDEDTFIGRGIPDGGRATCQQTHVNYDYGQYVQYERVVGVKCAAPTDYLQDVKAMRAAALDLGDPVNFAGHNLPYSFDGNMLADTPQTPDFDPQGILNMLSYPSEANGQREPESIDLPTPVTQYTPISDDPASRPKLKPKYQFRQEPVSPESAYGTMSPQSHQTSDSPPPVASPASEDLYGSPAHVSSALLSEHALASSASEDLYGSPAHVSSPLLSEHALESSPISQVDQDTRVDSIEQWLKGHPSDALSNPAPCDDLKLDDVLGCISSTPGSLVEPSPAPAADQHKLDEDFKLALDFIEDDLNKNSSEVPLSGVPVQSWKPGVASVPPCHNIPPAVSTPNVPTLSPSHKVSWNGGGIINGTTAPPAGMATIPQVTLPQNIPTAGPTYNVTLSQAVTLPSQQVLSNVAPAVVLPPNTIVFTVPTPSRSGLRPLLPKPVANSCHKMEPQMPMPITSRVGRGNPLQMAGLDLHLLQKQAIHELRKNAELDIQTLLAPDEEGDTRLAVAAIYGMTNQVFAELQRLKHVNCLEKIINLPSHTGHTPLYYAVSFNYPQIVALLLHFGAEPNLQPYNATSRMGLSALHCGAQNGDSHLQTLKVLLASEKLDINLLSKQGGKTAVHIAAEKHGKMKPVEGQADSMVNSLGIILTLLSNGADLNLKDISGHTGLHSIIKTGDVNLLRAVLSPEFLSPTQAHLALRQLNSQGNSCLHVLAEVSMSMHMSMQDMNAAVNLLLDKGADVLHRNKNGQVARDLFHPDQKEVRDLLNRRYRSTKKMENGRS